MKNIFRFLFIALVAMGCEPDPDIYDGPGQAHFPQSSYDYFVTSAEGAYEVPVYLTKAVGEDRTVTVEVSGESTAEEGVHFSIASKSVTIPAGELSAPVSITGDFEALGTDGPQELVLTITQTENTAGFRQQTTVNLIQFCEYDINSLAGIYTMNSSFFEAQYPVVSQAGDGDALDYEFLYQADYPITIEIIQIDDVTFEASIADQAAWYSAFYETDVYIRGSGQVNTCGQLTLSIEHYIPGLGSFGSYTEVLVLN
ncbi:hypothetical protein [Mangrovivirga cuniculi]|nr:hypothetical protein [Mangrovivirga cuniculi]